MSSLIETVLFVFGLVALGYACGVFGYLRPEIGDAVSEFAVRLALPLLLFRTMAQANFHGAAPWALWASYFFAVADGTAGDAKLVTTCPLVPFQMRNTLSCPPATTTRPSDVVSLA